MQIQHSPVSRPAFSVDKHKRRTNFRQSAVRKLLVFARLAQGGLNLRLLHQRRSDLLAEFDKLNLADRWEASTGWNQVTHDHILLKTTQPIDFA